MLKITSENEPGSRVVDRAGLAPKWGQVQHVKEKKEGDSSPRPTRVGLPVPKPKRVQNLCSQNALNSGFLSLFFSLANRYGSDRTHTQMGSSPAQAPATGTWSALLRSFCNADRRTHNSLHPLKTLIDRDRVQNSTRRLRLLLALSIQEVRHSNSFYVPYGKSCSTFLAQDFRRSNIDIVCSAFWATQHFMKNPAL